MSALREPALQLKLALIDDITTRGFAEEISPHLAQAFGLLPVTDLLALVADCRQDVKMAENIVLLSTEMLRQHMITLQKTQRVLDAARQRAIYAVGLGATVDINEWPVQDAAEAAQKVVRRAMDLTGGDKAEAPSNG